MEDDEGCALLFKKKLERHGYQVDLAYDGQEGLELCREQKYDLIAVDYQMPIFGGLEVIERLKARGELPPTIVVTGMGDEKVAVKAIKMGADDYIVKDTHNGYFQLLPSIIEKVLLQRRLMSERQQTLEALRESQRTLLTLMSNLPGMAYRRRNDEQGTMEFVSEGCTSITGLQPADFINNPERPFLSMVLAEDREQLRQEVNQALEECEPFQLVYRIQDVNGQIKWCWEQGRGVYGAEGELLALEGFINDVTESKTLEAQLRASLEEKEVLLREIHHRVKNNLQVISSLLNLQARQISDDRLLSVLMESRQRILSMAGIHEELYRSKNLSRINFKGYLKNLIHDLSSTYKPPNQQVQIDAEIDPVSLGIDQAIPCALIINELFANSLKYAFPNERQGRIHIDFRCNADNHCTLIIQDNGIGLPLELDIRTTKTLGLRLVRILSSQLKAQLDIEREQGTTFRLEFLSKTS